MYVTGPTLGCLDDNRAEFADAAARLRAVGLAVVTPFEILDRLARDLGEALPYLALDLMVVALAEADGVVALPGWEGSDAAVGEVVAASTLGKPVVGLHEYLALVTPLVAAA